jgi:hypothetical protein
LGASGPEQNFVDLKILGGYKSGLPSWIRYLGASGPEQNFVDIKILGGYKSGLPPWIQELTISLNTETGWE